MSRIGKHPIPIPAGVNIKFENGILFGSGKGGTFEFKVHDSVIAKVSDGVIYFNPSDDSRLARAMWGTCRAIVDKFVSGLVSDFVQKVDLVGVGYKAAVQGKKLVMQLGYSHDIEFDIPEDVKISCEKPTTVVIAGANKQRVGEITRKLQTYRAPEPYKGKGVIIQGQYVYRKEGKKK